MSDETDNMRRAELKSEMDSLWAEMSADATKERAKMRTSARQYFASQSDKTPDDLQAKAQQLHEIFDVLMEQPLVRKYRRENLQLKIDQNSRKDILAGIFLDKYVVVSPALLRELSLDELRHTLTHEIGHHAFLDGHPKNILNREEPNYKRNAEFFADSFATLVTQDAKNGISGLRKIVDIAERGAQKSGIDLNDPTLEERVAAMEAIGEDISQGRLEEKVRELDKMLSDKHHKVFPTYFERSIPNKRQPSLKL